MTATVQLGFAGDFSLPLVRANGERTQLDSWRSVTLWPGDTLRAGSPRNSRCGVVAVRGLVAPLVLGSASTYMRALLGGYGGRALAAGDKLSASAMPLKAGMVPTEQILRRPRAPERGAMRVVLGPQADHFDAAALASFFGSEYQVSTEVDRMGVRLQGPALLHNDRGGEIVSDATVPGSIQVPGNGLPIVLLADGQTAGGYPKIAIGTPLRFESVTVAQAEVLAREHEAGLRRLLSAIEPLALDGDVDLHAMYNANLVSGMIDAFDPR